MGVNARSPTKMKVLPAELEVAQIMMETVEQVQEL